VVDSVKRVTDIVAEIAAASQEQSSGIEQVNQAISQMDQVTQQNAALVEQAAAAAGSLNEQAAKLERTVGVFKIDGATAIGRQQHVALPTAKVASVSRPVAAPKRPNPPATRAITTEAPNGGGDWEQF
jgi:uncharacterized phage infection (PIP) family protein YhgE